MKKKILRKLINIVGERAVTVEPVFMSSCAYDELSFLKMDGKFLPDAVVRPKSAFEVSRILRVAGKEKIPVTARGGATGLCGGCVPVSGGIVLSFERMSRVLGIDKIDRLAVVEPGLTLSSFYEAVQKQGLFFPLHPGDENAQIGGIIATNAGGSRTVKYGSVRNHIRGIEVVLADGRIVNLGGKFAKNSSGYNLLNLFIGSEGTLGVITKAIVSLIVMPAEMSTLLVPFHDLSSAIKAVPDILGKGLLPAAIEFMQKDIVDYAHKKFQYRMPVKEAAAYLMIIFEAQNKDELDKSCLRAAEVCLENKAEDVFVADSPKKQNELLMFRGRFYEALKPDMVEDLDLVVPLSKIAELVEFSHMLQKKYAIQLITYGHAADGNVHVHVMKKSKTEAGDICSIKKALYKKTRELGGMLSGEHGIGMIKKNELPDFVGAEQIDFMKKIKKVFDPKGILNPGKIF